MTIRCLFKKTDIRKKPLDLDVLLIRNWYCVCFSNNMNFTINYISIFSLTPGSYYSNFQTEHHFYSSKFIYLYVS